MNHDKDLDRQLDIALLRFFDGQLSLSQTRKRIKQVTGRCFLDMGEMPVVMDLQSKINRYLDEEGIPKILVKAKRQRKPKP